MISDTAERIQLAWDQNRNWIAMLFVLCVVIYFMLAFADQAWRARELQAEADQQRAAIAAIESDNAALSKQVAVYGSDAYIAYVESRARRDLNLAHPDETVLMVRWGARVESSAAEPTMSQQSEPEPNWKRWVDTFRSR